MMGEEAEYLDSQCDWGAAEDSRRHDIEMSRKAKAERRSFKHAVKVEVEKQLSRHGIKPEIPRGEMVDRICQCGCGVNFKARKADVKRGWGKFSSKACAAKFKDKTTGGKNREYYGS